MTERPLSITTQLATPIQSAFNSTASISANDALPIVEAVDEEPYTIKCICDYSDDDGMTIYCETCDTWQHIDCFYPGRIEDAQKKEFDHSCADCKPRPLDRRLATERQRLQRQNKAGNDNGDKKTKRPPSKSHKKKTKPSDLQVTGTHDRDGYKHGSPHEHSSHSHAKKAKGHRSKESISQMKRSPPFTARPHNHAHPPSPAHTPPDLPNSFQVHGYSDIFLALYDDPQTPPSSTNSFASLSVGNTMSLWLHEPERLQVDAGVEDQNDVFQYLKVTVQGLKWPELRVEEKSARINDMSLRWQTLVTPTHLPSPGRIGELNGHVGFQKDYCNDTENRWPESAHPRPFVFFHPRLPLFIDTRREGSNCRYVRRSCRANTNLETFIAGGSEYHFWLTSERPLAANEQITIPWDFRFPSHCRSRFLHLLHLSDDDGVPFDGADITDEEYDQLTSMIYLVLSDYGGCACDLGNDCAFARFHRNHHGRSHAQANGVKSKKQTRKPKQSHVSPTSTGHATNSRAASEGQPEQYDEDESRSVSGSSRSKPHSRDLTPSQGLVETNGILTEPTDREKRKLAMVEENFRKMEQGQPPRKKKRPSDGSNISVPAVQATPKPRQRSVAPRMSISQPAPAITNGSRSRNYVDASTSRMQSGSPFSTRSPTGALPYPGNALSSSGSLAYRSRQPSIAPRSNYTDSFTQTDEVENAWWSIPKPKVKRIILPLAKRLLKTRHKTQAQEQVLRMQQSLAAINGEERSIRASPAVSLDLDVPMTDERSNAESPTDLKDRNMSVSSSTPSVDIGPTDITMTDAPTVQVSNAIKPPPPPWPGQPINSTGLNTRGLKSPDLRVQMPPTPSFSIPSLNGPLSGSVTPSSATGSTAQSPFGTVHFPVLFAAAPTVNGIHPSPVKTTKKLSLSDYKAARMKKTDTSNKLTSESSPTVASSVLKPLLSAVEEIKSLGILEGSAIVDSPVVEKTLDPMVSASVVPIMDPTSKNNLPSDTPNGTL